MPITRKKPQNLLLCSNGILDDPGFLERVKPWMTELFGLKPGKTKKILYVPFALNSPNRHGDEARQALLPLGIEVITAQMEDAPVKLLNQVEGIIVGGGNTYKLHEKLQRSKLGEEIRKRVEAGMPYMGVSAGAVLACPSIQTTSDAAPHPPSNDPYHGLGLVRFQIAPHYTSNVEKNMRLLSHADRQNLPVIGLRDDTALRIRGNRIELLGTDKAVLLKPDRERIALAQQLRFRDAEDAGHDQLYALYESASSPPECEPSVIQAALPRADKKRAR